VSADLDVYLHRQKVGQLRLQASRRFEFQYAPAWCDNPHAVPLSLSLAVRAEPYGDELARPFFANLLPEAELRRAIARRLGLSEQNDFALLEAIGGECAGAVSVIPQGSELPGQRGYRTLDKAGLEALVADLPKHPMLAGEEGVRLSLAGVQDKIPVYYDGKQVSIGLGDSPSSHILKPPIARIPHTVENEAFCMQLAARMGLPVPEVTLLEAGQRLYLVQRYDRVADSEGNIQRLHQEDFCQALSVPPDAKYEKEGGPGLQQCFDLVREHSIQPVVDLKHLLNWVVFNYLIGNADSHGKNLSLLLTDQGPRLAPFYDLLCTAVYDELTDRLAMRIGGEDRPDWIIARSWQQFAQEVGMGFKLVEQTLTKMSAGILEEARDLANDLARNAEESNFYAGIMEVIEQRVKKINRAFAVVEGGGK